MQLAPDTWRSQTSLPVGDGAGVEEKAARAAQSMDRVTSLRVSLFSMMFSFVVSSLEPLRLRGRWHTMKRGNDTPGGRGCQRACGLSLKGVMSAAVEHERFILTAAQLREHRLPLFNEWQAFYALCPVRR